MPAPPRSRSPLPASPPAPATAPGHLLREAGDPFPRDLHVVARPPAAGWEGYGGPVVVLVHGSLDRAASFTRTVRRLPEAWGCVAYDRRGYQGSRSSGPVPLEGHVDDLLAVAAAAAAAGGAGRSVVTVGHSMGGVVALGAALAEPRRFTAVGAYEPPMPWLGFPREGAPASQDAPPADPAAEAERFFRRMVGDGAWERLSGAAKASRREDGPALVAELASLRRGAPAPFDVTALTVPVVFGCGGPATEPRRRRTAAWLAEHVAGGHLVEIPQAGHGAHLGHPTAFADLVRATVALGSPDGGQPPRRGGPDR
ncbi:MAG: alpha/beta fold hydrolase [Acidimicrobiales bacterium]